MSTPRQNANNTSDGDPKNETANRIPEIQQKDDRNDAIVSTSLLKSPRSDKADGENDINSTKDKNKFISQDGGVVRQEAVTSSNPTQNSVQKHLPTETNPSNSTFSKSWDRQWTLGELRQETQSWTLASDSGLLKYLAEVSTNLIKRTKELEGNVYALATEAKSVNVKLHNTFNQFLMLSNTQFIENRVYDEDETALSAEQNNTQAKTTTELTQNNIEEILIPKFKEAVKYALEALKMTSLANTTEASGPEDEDTEAAASVAAANSEPKATPPKSSPAVTTIIPKDSYFRRPLPFIIGTREFQDDEYCGLYYEDETESEIEEEEEESSEMNNEEDLSSTSFTDDENETEETGEAYKKEQNTEKGNTESAKEAKTENNNNVAQKSNDGDIFGGHDNGDEEESGASQKTKANQTTASDQKADATKKSDNEESDNEKDNEPKDFTSLLEASLRSQLSGQKEPEKLRKKREKKRKEILEQNNDKKPDVNETKPSEAVVADTKKETKIQKAAEDSPFYDPEDPGNLFAPTKATTTSGFLDLLSSSEPSKLFEIDDENDILGHDISKPEDKSSGPQTDEKVKPTTESKDTTKQSDARRDKDPFAVLLGSNFDEDESDTLFGAGQKTKEAPVITSATEKSSLFDHDDAKRNVPTNNNKLFSETTSSPAVNIANLSQLSSAVSEKKEKDKEPAVREETNATTDGKRKRSSSKKDSKKTKTTRSSSKDSSSRSQKKSSSRKGSVSSKKESTSTTTVTQSTMNTSATLTTSITNKPTKTSLFDDSEGDLFTPTNAKDSDLFLEGVNTTTQSATAKSSAAKVPPVSTPTASTAENTTPKTLTTTSAVISTGTTAKKSVFDFDDDDENVSFFSAGKNQKPSDSKTESKKKLLLFDYNEDVDQPNSATTQAAVEVKSSPQKEVNKPTEKTTESTPIEKQSSKPVERPVPSAAEKPSIFDVDDDGDIFSLLSGQKKTVASPTSAVSSATSSMTTSVVPNAPVSSLKETVTSTKEKNELSSSELSIKASSPPLQKKDTKTEEQRQSNKNESSPVINPKQQPVTDITTSAKKSSIWNDDDDDDDTNIFSFDKKKTTAPLSNVKENPPNVKENLSSTATATNSVTTLLSDANTVRSSVSEKVSLFNSVTEQNASKSVDAPEKVSATSSLLSSGKIADKISLSEEPKQQQSQPFSKITAITTNAGETNSISATQTIEKSVADKISLFDKKEESLPPLPTKGQEPEPLENSMTKPTSRVAAIGAALRFNPAITMMPGARRPKPWLDNKDENSSEGQSDKDLNEHTETEKLKISENDQKENERTVASESMSVPKAKSLDISNDDNMSTPSTTTTNSMKSLRLPKTAKLTHMTMERPKMGKRRLPSRFATASGNSTSLSKRSQTLPSNRISTVASNFDSLNEPKRIQQESIFEPRDSDDAFPVKQKSENEATTVRQEPEEQKEIIVPPNVGGMAPSEAKEIANLANQVIAKRKGIDGAADVFETQPTNVPTKKTEAKETKSVASIFEDVATVSVESNIKVSSLFPKKQQTQLPGTFDSSSAASVTAPLEKPLQSSVDSNSNVKVSSVLPQKQTTVHSAVKVSDKDTATDVTKSIFDDLPLPNVTKDKSNADNLTVSPSLPKVQSSVSSATAALSKFTNSTTSSTLQQAKIKSIFDDVLIPVPAKITSLSSPKESTMSVATAKPTELKTQQTNNTVSLSSIFNDLPPANTKTTKTPMNIFDDLPPVNIEPSSTQSSSKTKNNPNLLQSRKETTSDEIQKEKVLSNEAARVERKEASKNEPKKETTSDSTPSVTSKSPVATIFDDFAIPTSTTSKTYSTAKKSTIDDIFGNPEELFVPKSTTTATKLTITAKANPKLDIFDNPLDTNKDSSIFKDF